MNYYEIHKNKKPKSIFKRKRKQKFFDFECIVLKNQILTFGKVQEEIIKAQILPNSEAFGLKRKAIAENTLKTMAGYFRIQNLENQRRFNTTKRYVK